MLILMIHHTLDSNDFVIYPNKCSHRHILWVDKIIECGCGLIDIFLNDNRCEAGIYRLDGTFSTRI